MHVLPKRISLFTLLSQFTLNAFPHSSHEKLIIYIREMGEVRKGKYIILFNNTENGIYIKLKMCKEEIGWVSNPSIPISCCFHSFGRITKRICKSLLSFTFQTSVSLLTVIQFMCKCDAPWFWSLSDVNIKILYDLQI